LPARQGANHSDADWYVQHMCGHANRALHRQGGVPGAAANRRRQSAAGVKLMPDAGADNTLKLSCG
jgi:hypothetical protein